MVTTYTTPERVASLLQYTENAADGLSQVRKPFDANSEPTAEEVEEVINESEDWIDRYCETAWRETSIANEYHDFLSSMNRWGSYIDRAGQRIYVIQLKHQFVRTFDANEGDKIEVWTGTQWKDFVVDYILGQAMYNGDYWVDYELGEIFLFNRFPAIGQRMISITYRYGEISVPSTIKRACALLAGAIINERYELFMQTDKDGSPAMNTAEKWREMAYKILDEYRLKEVEVV